MEEGCGGGGEGKQKGANETLGGEPDATAPASAPMYVLCCMISRLRGAKEPRDMCAQPVCRTLEDGAGRCPGGAKSKSKSKSKSAVDQRKVV